MRPKYEQVKFVNIFKLIYRNEYRETVVPKACHFIKTELVNCDDTNFTSWSYKGNSDSSSGNK